MNEGPSFARIPARAAGMRLTATDWAVLHVIALHADKAGLAYPSLARIAQIAQIRRNHVSRSTKRLEELGLLRSKRLARGSGWANTHYEVVFEVAPDTVLLDTGMAPETGAPKAGVAPEVVLGGTSSGTTGGTSDGALTYQLTDHRTDLTKEEESQIENKAAGGTSGGSTPAPCQSGPPCRWYVTNATGFRLCGQPAIDDTDRCADHARAVTSGKPHGQAVH